MGKLKLKMAVISFSLLQLSFPIKFIINVNTFQLHFTKKTHKDQKRKRINKYSKKKKTINSDNNIVPLCI